MIFVAASQVDTLVYIMDIVGIVACATAGTILAMKKHFDFFGCILVSMVNAIGGGTIRDVILGRLPLFWVQDLHYLYIISAVSLLVQLFINHSHKISGMLKFFDAIGLAAFSVIGLTVARRFGVDPVICVLMAVLTSIAGGIMRDMICNEIPLVLQKEIYISASIIGSWCFFAFLQAGLGQGLAQVLAMVVIFTIRMLALRFDWHLPSLGGRF